MDYYLGDGGMKDKTKINILALTAILSVILFVIIGFCFESGELDFWRVINVKQGLLLMFIFSTIYSSWAAFIIYNNPS